MNKQLEKIRNEVEKRTFKKQGFSSELEEYGFHACAREILFLIDRIEDELPKWKKTLKDNGCWSGEIGVNPSKRLYEYEHYTINADELFKLLDKEK